MTPFWKLEDCGDFDYYTLIDTEGNEAGTLRRELAEHVLSVLNAHEDKLQERREQERQYNERREDERRLEAEGIGGARKGDEVIVKTSKGPYQGKVKTLYPYTNSIFVWVQFKPRERHPDEFDTHNGLRGVTVEVSAIARNVSAEQRQKEANQ